MATTHQPAPALKSDRRRVAILPIGSIEQHGPYLPVDTDARIAELLAQKLSVGLGEEMALLLPALPFSCSWEHAGLGTVALTVTTLAATIHDIAKSLMRWETPFLLLLVNWHGGNDLLGALATEITAVEQIPCAVIPGSAQVGAAWERSRMTTAKDVHGGAIETGIMRAYWPELVPEAISGDAHFEPQIAPAKTQPVLQAIGSYGITRQGIWGAPEDADPEKARILIEQLVQSMVVQVKALLELVDQHQGQGV
ncbi:creatininase family protein [Ktedonobacter racemifer]|uniref:Creatininase n=1 Tax=Ktedonobacter racemifer DSM 44963 TaxID=485913 RepID=D6U0K9_KTERA|nr:creatininase family protein [Ktedonobacter racemifer]EFH82349.1 Creatininase [Ktedonobacter racemifer DSM 44963]